MQRLFKVPLSLLREQDPGVKPNDFRSNVVIGVSTRGTEVGTDIVRTVIVVSFFNFIFKLL